MSDLAKHIQHYLPLFGILFLSVFGFSLFPKDEVFKITIIIATGVSYIAWGIVHHKLHHDLYLAVIIEYVAVAALGAVIALSLLFWS